MHLIDVNQRENQARISKRGLIYLARVSPSNPVYLD